MIKKISIIGAGSVGSNTAFLLTVKNLCREIVLLDIEKDLAKGLALDLSDAKYLLSSSVSIKGTGSFKDIAASDIVVITAGRARAPGMAREDLIKINAKIVKEVSLSIKKYAPAALIIVVTNPLDLMVSVALRFSQFSSSRVIGMGGSLDSSRLAHLLLERIKDASIEDIKPMVIGAHGKGMIASKLSRVKNFDLDAYISEEKFEKVKEDTVSRGARIVSCLKRGSARFAPACGVLEIIEAIVADKKKVLFCSTCLDGEYGIKNVSLGVPVVVGRSGIVKVLEVALPKEEIDLLKTTARELKEAFNAL